MVGARAAAGGEVRYEGGALMRQNRRMVLTRRPQHSETVTSEHFTLEASEIPDLAEGQFLVRNCWLGLDPAQRGWLREDPSYVTPVALGETMRGSAVGEVVESRNSDFPVGAIVSGFFGWQTFVIVTEPSDVWIVPGTLERFTSALGLLGTPGLTAYFGMLDLARPKPGDWVVVTAAAGATGSVAAQLARLAGATVVGVAGGPAKCEWLTQVAGLDHAIDYHSENVAEQLSKLRPEGIDVVYDNVGGWLLDACLDSIANGATVVIGGAIASRYSSDAMELRSVSNLPMVMTRRATVHGFLVLDYAHRYREARERLAGFAADGALTTSEDVVVGTLLDAPGTLQRLFDGSNLGKQVLEIGKPELVRAAP